ncbi:hypothetical protein PPL_00476 [Heterostelium album PN500]|uniref:RGS domain-containing protein n=1 Tax=Heterostelium pallidum (strain ATCC 26659 / Pp 5 / PN500) TaxID=670386 RepID=D3AWK1_HETP5|nr:hypothetical protein PPL_00476 [Heterostelium album PN500]EFA86674.1 hypothetical protein PPL_00476 [Heterostelium album PN500]|eukprot:XP_020438778.1 hypothetical protein PPL_00476 [Heterostelium album PN500]
MIYPNDVMNEVLRDENGCNLFKNYLKTIYCSETLQFWLEIEMFKTNAPPAANQSQGGPLLAFSSIDPSQLQSSSSSSNNTPPASPPTNSASSSPPKKEGCFKSSRSNSPTPSDRKFLSQEELRIRAQSIFDRYLENGSEFELNVDCISRDAVRLRLQDEIDASIFDDVQKTIYESLWMDCFPPFTHTTAYHKYKQETGKCHLPEFLRISFKRKSQKNDFGVISMKDLNK